MVSKDERARNLEHFHIQLQHLFDAIHDIKIHDSQSKFEGVGIMPDGKQVIAKIEIFPLEEVKWERRVDNDPR